MTTVTHEQQLERLEAIHAVQNLQARYDYLHAAHLHEERLPLFALDTPGVRIEFDWGVYEGRAGVERFFRNYQAQTHQGLPGELAIHTLTTQVIEVADDLRTARAVWLSPGAGAGAFPGQPKHAGWLYIRYNTDFVREDGTWKIWRLHVSLVFGCSYEESWVQVKPMPVRRELPAGCEPDRARVREWAGYRTDKAYLAESAPPLPYHTFSDLGLD